MKKAVSFLLVIMCLLTYCSGSQAGSTEKAMMNLPITAGMINALRHIIGVPLMRAILPGNWVLYSGGGASEWSFHADGALDTGHTWTVEAADGSIESLWSDPPYILRIDKDDVYGLHFDWERSTELWTGSFYTDEEEASPAPISFYISITDDMTGGGYYKTK